MNSRADPQHDLSGLAGWAPELAQTFVSLASDIALVLDDEGIIHNVARVGTDPLSATAHDWVGRQWADTVTSETRGKVDQLLKEVASTGLGRRREINHPSQSGGNIAVAYTAIRLGNNGPVLAVGRDLGAIMAIQQRFLEAQRDLEQGYWRARQAESRYRLLFQVATDAVLVVDSTTLEILEANHAASQLFELPADQLAGRQATFGFEKQSRASVTDLLAAARASAQPAEIRARLIGKVQSTSISATPFRAGDAMRLMVRIRLIDVPGTSVELNATLARLVDSTSDGVVVTDSSGRVLVANPAFLKLIRVGSEAAVKGLPLMDWIGLSEEQFAKLMAQVRLQGITRRVGSRMLANDAHLALVEVSAALLTEGDQECIGFTIHVAERLELARPDSGWHGSMASLFSQIGSAELSELLKTANRLIEQQFAAHALNICGADPAAAAILLGVTRERLNEMRPGDLPPSEGV